METYWCLKKNSIIEMMKNPENYGPAFASYLKSE
jgi:hypothetical protein